MPPLRKRVLRAAGLALIGGGLAIFIFRFVAGESPAGIPKSIQPARNNDIVIPSAVTELPRQRVAAPIAKESGFEVKWSAILQQPATAERNAQLARELKELTKIDPETANARLLALDPADRVAVVATLLRDAAWQGSDEAVTEAIRWCDEDQPYSLEHGRSLIAVLAEMGDYRAALRFVMGESLVAYLGENPSKWVTTLFLTWSKSDPEAAARAAVNLVEVGMRGEALQALAAGWITTQPAALAKFMWQLPIGGDRMAALETTFGLWANVDPGAAAAWITKLDAGPERDAGLAAVAGSPRFMSRESSIALDWARSIANPGLRSATLSTVVWNWAGFDRFSAQNFAATSPDLKPGDRAALLNRLAEPRPVTGRGP